MHKDILSKLEDFRGIEAQPAAENTNKYAPIQPPRLMSSNIVAADSRDTYRFEVHIDCEVLSLITYHMIFLCYPLDSDHPCLMISAEGSNENAVFFCVTIGDKRQNFGSDKNWLDPETFITQALIISELHFNGGS